MTRIVDEQADAAVQHADVLLDRQFQASRCHPTDAVFRLPLDRMPGFAGTLRDRFLAELSRPGLRLCVHALRRQLQPLFYRTWVPSRLVCHQCRPPVISTPAGYPWDMDRAARFGGGLPAPDPRDRRPVPAQWASLFLNNISKS